MRPPDLRPSDRYRPEERPPPGVATVASCVAFATLLLLAISPMLVVSGLFTAGICAVAVRVLR